MKTPRFWYPQPGDKTSELEVMLLSPLSHVFEAGTALRRKLASPYRSPKPLICIGNVVAGGAGKTPTALALASMFKEYGYKPVFVTRGYGGSGSVRCVDLHRHDAGDVGDEAMLLSAVAPTWVGRDRVKAVREAETHGSMIIADDGFQNPNLSPSASILVIDGEAGIGNGRIIPAGPLREPLGDALNRATVIVVIGNDRYNIASRAKLPVFQAHLEPQAPRGFKAAGKYIAFAGIGRPSKFFATAKSMKLDLAATREFPDHYVYTTEDIDSLRLDAEVMGARLVTTEKDAVRLPPYFRSEVIVIPIRLVFDVPGAGEVLAELLMRRP